MKRVMNLAILVLLMAAILLVSPIGCKSDSNGVKETKAGAETKSDAEPKPGSDADEKPYVIGFCSALTGAVAQGGLAQQFGAELAIKEINEAGGINGRTLELLSLDDAADVAQAPIVAQTFVDNEDVVAVIAHGGSTLTAATQPIFEEAGLCNISPCSSTASLADNNMKHWLRMVISNADQVPQIVAFAKNNLGLGKMAIIYANDDNGATWRDAAIEGAEKLGVEVVLTETYNPGTETDFTTIITKVKAAGADFYTFSGDYSDGGAMLKQFDDLGVDIPCVTLSQLTYQTTLNIAGEAAVDKLYCLCTFNPYSERTVNTNFRNAYQENFGENEIPTGPSMGTYDAVYLIAQALKEGATRETMAAWIKNLDGVHDGTFTMEDICLGEGISWTEKGEVAAFGIAPVCVDESISFKDFGKPVDTKGLN